MATDDVTVIEIQAGDGISEFWIFRYFLDGDRLAGLVELDDAEALRVVDFVAEDSGTGVALGGRLEFGREALAIEDVVAEDQGAALVANELLADEQGLGQTIGAGLLGA